MVVFLRTQRNFTEFTENRKLKMEKQKQQAVLLGTADLTESQVYYP